MFLQGKRVKDLQESKEVFEEKLCDIQSLLRKDDEKSLNQAKLNTTLNKISLVQKKSTQK